MNGQMIEVKTPLTHRDYSHLVDQQDPLHLTVNKIRRCFMYNNQYFQLDIYKDPCHPRYNRKPYQNKLKTKDRKMSNLKLLLPFFYFFFHVCNQNNVLGLRKKQMIFFEVKKNQTKSDFGHFLDVFGLVLDQLPHQHMIIRK